jgi:hypothetical protein
MENWASAPSIQSILRSIVSEPQPANLEFITISKPSDIKEEKTRQTISRHAAQSSARKTKKRRRYVTKTFDLPAAEAELDTRGPPLTLVIAGDAATENAKVILDSGNLEIHPLRASHFQLYLLQQLRKISRPLGHGIGPITYSGSPIIPDSRSTMLMEFSKFSRRRSSRGR